MSSESGRSMVEMLGVLAIMGVLSIGAVVAFSAGMAKTRANTLWNESWKRATVVAGQIGLRNETPTLKDFVVNEYGFGNFSSSVYGATGEAEWTQTDRQFTLLISGVEGRVCNIMKKNMDSAVKVFVPDSCDTKNLNDIKLTFNNDLSTEDLPPVEEGPFCDAGEFVVDENGERKCCRGYRIDSNNWSGYSGYQCCKDGQSVNGYGECIDCGAGNYYNMSYADIQGRFGGTDACAKRCTKNEECDEGKFCYMDAYATQAESSVDPIVGTCVSPDDVGGLVERDIIVSGAPKGHWIGPRKALDWWSARNFCLRFGGVDLPTRLQICGSNVPAGSACGTPLRIAIEQQLSVMQNQRHFWLEETGTGKAYYVDPSGWSYRVKIPPERTARARPAGVVCGPVNNE